MLLGLRSGIGHVCLELLALQGIGLSRRNGQVKNFHRELL